MQENEIHENNQYENEDSLYKDDQTKKDTAYRTIEKIFKIEFRQCKKRSKKMVKIPLNEEQRKYLVQFPEHLDKSLNSDFVLINHMQSLTPSTVFETPTKIDCTNQPSSAGHGKNTGNKSIWDGLHMQHPSKWRIYASDSIGEGFYFIKNVFTPDQEYYWSKRCLLDYPQYPNKTNLDLHHGGYLQESIWHLLHIKSSGMSSEKNEYDLSNDKDEVPVNDITSVGNNNIQQQSIQSSAQIPFPTVVSLKNLNKDTLTVQLNKMTWCTLGYQYEWTSRKYIRSLFAPFPKDASQLCTKIANVVGVEEYLPEAAIVNFYHENMRMGGHKDESEETMAKPIVSVSFGSSAIYLLGGETRDVKPIPILIESGDVMILGGVARTWYHGIARIIEDSCPEYWNPKNHEDNEEREAICKFLYSENRRINMNVRQVYDESMD